MLMMSSVDKNKVATDDFAFKPVKSWMGNEKVEQVCGHQANSATWTQNRDAVVTGKQRGCFYLHCLPRSWVRRLHAWHVPDSESLCTHKCMNHSLLFTSCTAYVSMGIAVHLPDELALTTRYGTAPGGTVRVPPHTVSVWPSGCAITHNGLGAGGWLEGARLRGDGEDARLAGRAPLHLPRAGLVPAVPGRGRTGAGQRGDAGGPDEPRQHERRRARRRHARPWWPWCRGGARPRCAGAPRLPASRDRGEAARVGTVSRDWHRRGAKSAPE
jgi:hypothetical protein